MYIRLYVTLAGHAASGTNTGSVFITGLPFTAVAGHAGCATGYFAGFQANQSFVTATVQPSSNQLLLRHILAAGSTATATMDYPTQVQTGTTIIFSASYLTTAG